MTTPLRNSLCKSQSLSIMHNCDKDAKQEDDNNKLLILLRKGKKGKKKEERRNNSENKIF